MLQTPGEGGTTELSLFVDEGGWDHPSRLRRYALGGDGFASLRAGAAGGDVLTRPLIFEGDRLVMNVSTAALGWLRVEVRDREGRTLYYGLLVTPAADPGAPIRLRFALKDADLHSLRFR